MRAALDFVRESMGQSKIVVFRHLFAGNEMRAARANDAFEAAYARAVDDGGVVAMPGATGVFAELREMGVKVCLTTGFAPPTRDGIIDALRWHTLVDLVLSPADAGRGRPAPDMILTAVLRLEIEAVDDVAVAGDTVSDLISGTRARRGRRRRSAHRCARPQSARGGATHAHRRLDRRSAGRFARLSGQTCQVASAPMPAADLDQVVNLCKRRGFVFPSAEIYGGFRSTYDYGPLGVADASQRQGRVVAGDGAAARRHRRHRRRDLVAARGVGGVRPPAELHRSARRLHACATSASASTSSTTRDCPNCGARQRSPRPAQFNLMFKTHAGPVEDDGRGGLSAPRDRAGHVRQLRQRAADDAQEAAVRHRADRQVVPQRDHAAATSCSAPASSSRWRSSSSCRPTRRRSGTSTGATSGCSWYIDLGIPADMLRLRAHDADELSHYSSGTSDVEFLFPWGWDELEGIANRGDYDLTQHAKSLGRAARVLRPGDERALRAARDRARGGRDPHDDGVPARRLRRGGGRRRDSAPCCASTPASRRTRSRCCRCRRRRR